MFKILCFALICASPLLAGSPFEETYAGKWRGVGIQSDGYDWDMQIALGPTMGEVRYPSLRCGGVWRYSTVTALGLSGIESITYGLENCIETGSIFLQPDGENQLIFMWCGEEDGVTAVALLVRGGSFEPEYERLRAASQATLDEIENGLENISCRGSQWFGV